MKKILTISLICIMLFSIVGCTKPIVKPIETTPIPTIEPIETVNPTESIPSEVVLTYYDEFINYIQNANQDKNFIVSPTSLRAALCLAIAGADEETLTELLKSAGFKAKEDAENWYNNILMQVKTFNTEIEKESIFGSTETNKLGAFEIVNSIWNNDSISEGFKQEYIDYVTNKFNATVDSDTADKLVEKINNWVNEKTRGMIPKIIENVNDITAILVNAIYLKAGWELKFNKELTHDDNFTCKDGTIITKTYMEELDHYYKYYADNNTRLVIIPMDGDTAFICVLGDISNIQEKINNAQFTRMHIVIPQLDIESSFENELFEFLKNKGVNLAFTENANFNNMCKSENWFIQGIIQKAKIKTDEDGLEAAAVTAITMGLTGMPTPDPNKIVDFIANEAFSFFIYSGLSTENPEMLFYGQVIN